MNFSQSIILCSAITTICVLILKSTLFTRVDFNSKTNPEQKSIAFRITITLISTAMLGAVINFDTSDYFSSADIICYFSDAFIAISWIPCYHDSFPHFGVDHGASRLPVSSAALSTSARSAPRVHYCALCASILLSSCAISTLLLFTCACAFHSLICNHVRQFLRGVRNTSCHKVTT